MRTFKDFRSKPIMQVCSRCGGFMAGIVPRKIIDGKVYHLHCGWKMEQEQIRKISDKLGGDDADTIHQGGGSNATVLEQRDKNSTPGSSSDTQG